MNKVMQFDSERFMYLRVMADKNGKILFCGDDVTNALGYYHSENALTKYCEADGVTMHNVFVKYCGELELPFIDEGNLYRLIANCSRKQQAEGFAAWVFGDVLPAVYKVRNKKESAINKELIPAMNLYFNNKTSLSTSQAQTLWNTYSAEFESLNEILRGSHHDHILSQRTTRAFCIHLLLSEKWSADDVQAFVNGLKRKPNCETEFDYTCYNFRNWYDRNVHGKIRDTKANGEKNRTAYTLNGLSVVADSYKTGQVYKSFAYKPTAQVILSKGYDMAQERFRQLECVAEERCGMNL